MLAVEIMITMNVMNVKLMTVVTEIDTGMQTMNMFNAGVSRLMKADLLSRVMLP